MGPVPNHRLVHRIPPEPGLAAGTIGPGDVRTIVGAVNLAEAIRRYGHLGAQLDPLGSAPWGDPSLAPEAHSITEADLHGLPASLVVRPTCAA